MVVPGRPGLSGRRGGSRGGASRRRGGSAAGRRQRSRAGRERHDQGTPHHHSGGYLLGSGVRQRARGESYAVRASGCARQFLVAASAAERSRHLILIYGRRNFEAQDEISQSSCTTLDRLPRKTWLQRRSRTLLARVARSHRQRHQPPRRRRSHLVIAGRSLGHYLRGHVGYKLHVN